MGSYNGKDPAGGKVDLDDGKVDSDDGKDLDDVKTQIISKTLMMVI